MTVLAPISLGTFAVEAGAVEVSAFGVATGVDETDGVPLTFPMRWLVMPSVRAVMLALVPEPDLVLVHESQSFDYAHRLRVDTRYDLALIARRDQGPDRLFIDGTLRDRDGVVVVRLETVLRLIAAPAP